MFWGCSVQTNSTFEKKDLLCFLGRGSLPKAATPKKTLSLPELMGPHSTLRRETDSSWGPRTSSEQKMPVFLPLRKWERQEKRMGPQSHREQCRKGHRGLHVCDPKLLPWVLQTLGDTIRRTSSSGGKSSQMESVS